MSYSKDMRRLVLDYVAGGGSKSEVLNDTWTHVNQDNAFGDVLLVTPTNASFMDTSIHTTANPSSAVPANNNTNNANDNKKEKAANDNKPETGKSQKIQHQLLEIDPFLAQEFEIDQRKFQF